MLQFAGAVTAAQLTLMALEDAAVAVSAVGVGGTAVHVVPGIVIAMVAECVIAPSVPLIETFVVPAGVPVCAKKLTVTVPVLLTEDGLKLALTPFGTLLADTETLPVRPPT